MCCIVPNNDLVLCYKAMAIYGKDQKMDLFTIKFKSQ